MQHRVDGFLHVHRLIEHDAGDHLLGNVIEVLNEGANAIDQGDRIGVPTLLHDRNVGRLLSVDANDVGLNPVSVLRFTDVAYCDPGITADCQRHSRQLIHVVDQAVGVHIVVVGAHLHVASGKNEIGTVDGSDDIHQAELPRRQLVRIDIDHDLAVDAAKHTRDFCAGDHRDLVSNLKLCVVVQLRFVQAFTFHRDEGNGQAGSIELQNHGRKSSGRQALQVGESQVGKLSDIGVGAGPGLEVDLDDAHAQH